MTKVKPTQVKSFSAKAIRMPFGIVWQGQRLSVIYQDPLGHIGLESLFCLCLCQDTIDCGSAGQKSEPISTPVVSGVRAYLEASCG